MNMNKGESYMDLVDYKIKVVDRDGNPMCNFPIVIRYIGESYYGRRTDRDTGIINFQITGRPVEIFIIAPKNFKNEKTQLIELEKIKGNYDLVASFSQDIPQEIKIPHSVNDYGTTEVIFNFYKNQITKQLYTEPLLVNLSFVHRIQRKKINVFLEAKNGKLRIRPIMYSSISMTPYHLDHTPFVHHDGKNVEVFIDTLPRNPSNDKEEVDIYFDIEETEGVTQTDSPVIEKKINIISNNTCGIEFQGKVKVTRYHTTYGPVYLGKNPLASYNKWDDLIAEGLITKNDIDIMCAVSPNEGNLDTVQSYDSEIVTAGAMQKTINIKGEGELPKQMLDFKNKYPQIFQSIFTNCGWTVESKFNKVKAYYREMTGSQLKQFIRTDCNQLAYSTHKSIKSPAIESLIAAISHPKYIELQILDFISRLNKAIDNYPCRDKKEKISL